MNHTYFHFGYVPAELHQESSVCLWEIMSKELRTYWGLDEYIFGSGLWMEFVDNKKNIASLTL